MLKHQPVVAYTAVFDPKSRDLRCARQACEMLGVELREVKIEAPTLEDLETVVRMIEMPHKAQVEIGWLCLGLARQIHEDGFKVLLSGEGADELFASYGNAYFGVKDKGWRGFRSESVIGQHRKNWARVNKVFMAYSIEGRLPFADAEVVAYGLTLPQSAVEPGGRTKGVLRDKYLGRVPDSVVNRPKAAFQTEAKITDAIPAADPTRFYRATFRSQFQGAKP
jgi:asparagine synthase (glutamine-hydrolysing)